MANCEEHLSDVRVTKWRKLKPEARFRSLPPANPLVSRATLTRDAGSQLDRRRAKLDALHADAEHPLQYRFDADHSAADLAGSYGELAAGARTEDRVSVAGRLNLIRRHGGLTFGVIRDRTGALQIFVDRAAVGEQTFQRFRALDRGDWIGVTGTVMRTDKGELSVARRGLRDARQGAAAAAGQGQGPRPTSRCATASATST